MSNLPSSIVTSYRRLVVNLIEGFNIKKLLIIFIIAGSIFLAWRGGYFDELRSKYQDDYWIELESRKVVSDISTERSIKELGGQVEINLKNCTQDLRKIDVTFGRTSVVVIGLDKNSNDCVVIIGANVDKSFSYSKFTYICKLPSTWKTILLQKNSYGINTNTIQDYCKTK